MTEAWRDVRVPADDACVLRPLLERRAAETPGKAFARFADGMEWTYRETRDVARRAAVGFRRLGVAQGDTVLSWLPNGPGCPARLVRAQLPRCGLRWCRATCASSTSCRRRRPRRSRSTVLRTEGVTADTWDRAAAGIEVKRERIGATTAPGGERRTP